MRRVLMLLAVPLTIAGCAASGPVRGWVSDTGPEITSAQLGKPFVDFGYTDDRWKSRMFHSELGDFTVLAFTRCDDNMHRPAVEWLQKIINENRATDNVRVVAVDVHWSPAGCKDHDQCHLIAGHPGLGTLCDATGAIHRAYGAVNEDWVYVIGPDRQILFSGPMKDAPQISRELKMRIDRLSHERIESDFGYYRKV